MTMGMESQSLMRSRFVMKLHLMFQRQIVPVKEYQMPTVTRSDSHYVIHLMFETDLEFATD